MAEEVAVDSELTLLPKRLVGQEVRLAGGLLNPFFGKWFLEFAPPKFPMLPATRLTGYTFEDLRGMIDRGLRAKNQGFFVVDSTSDGNAAGNQSLEAAALSLPKNRIRIERERAVTYAATGAIGYASWSSNDKQRLGDGRRALNFEWLPGGIATEYVSTNGRTFEAPPSDWRPGPLDDKGF